jgi:uncharacterized protein involved in type VI secretion and phage assembly
VSDHDLLLELAERLRSRFYGKYRGVVTDNNDPSGLMRIRATVPSVLGATPTGWALPCVPYAGQDVGMFMLPDSGAAVWIEFEGGDVSYPIWTGCYWRSGEPPSDASPTTRGVVSAAGAKLLFDDSANEVTLTDSYENTVKLSADGIEQTREGSSIAVGATSVSICDGAFEVM